MLDRPLFPFNWFWLADDGRIYSSAAQTIIEDLDDNLISEPFAPTRWPVDEDGQQTSEALAEVLAVHGLRLGAKDLDGIKAQLRTAIDDAAEEQRLRYITGGAGQAMTYAQKAEEARHCLDAAGPDPEHYPLLAAEIGITASTLVGVAQVVATANAQWLQIGAAIEAARLSAKKAISEAEGIEEARAAADAVVWPDP